eukprot:4588391-Amphidinium_carterae.2
MVYGGARGGHEREERVVTTERCLLDSSEQRLNNRRQLARLEEDYYDEEAGEEFIVYRPPPVNWLAGEDEWSLRWYLNDVIRLLRWVRAALPRLVHWVHYNRTPPHYFRLGGGAKRRYPFADVQDVAANLPPPPTVAAAEAEVRPPPGQAAVHLEEVCAGDAHPLVFIFHGSFAPYHPGHKAGLSAAVKFIQAQHLAISKIVIGCTAADQVETKHEDRLFSHIGLRTKIIAAVMEEGTAFEMPYTIDPVERRSGYALASAHAEDEFKVLYIVGPDVQRHPSRQTLVVTRSSEQTAKRGAYLDREKMAGVCLQQEVLNVSSTSMRSIMARGKIPGVYGPKARALINPIVWRMQQEKKKNAALEQAPISASGTTHVAGKSSAAPPSSSKRLAPAVDISSCRSPSAAVTTPAKAMPQKKLRQTPAASRQVSVGPNPAVGASVSVGLAPASTTTTPCAVRVPLARRRRSTVSLVPAPAPPPLPAALTDAPLAGQVNAEAGNPQLRVSDRAIMLTKPGVMKLKKTLFANLGVYWKNCVLPLGLLLR